MGLPDDHLGNHVSQRFLIASHPLPSPGIR